MSELLRIRSTPTAVAFAPDGLQVVTGCEDGRVRVWNRDSGELVHELPGGKAPVLGLLFSANGTTMVARSHELALRFFDWATQHCTTLEFPATVRAVSLEVDGKRAAVGCQNGQLFLVDLATGTKSLIGQHAAAVESLAFSTDGAAIVSGGADRHAHRWSVQGPLPSQPLASCSPFQNVALDVVKRVRAVHRVPDSGSWFLVTDQPRAFHWGGLQDQPATLPGLITSLAVHPDGALLAMTFSDQSAALMRWPITPGAAVPVADRVVAIQFSMMGRFLLVRCDDTTAQLMQTLDAVKPWVGLRGHSERLEAATVSRDEQWAATASADKTVRIWPTDPQQALAALRVPSAPRAVLEGLSASPGR